LFFVKACPDPPGEYFSALNGHPSGNPALNTARAVVRNKQQQLVLEKSGHFQKKWAQCWEKN
jgi:hypothetical protein